MDTILLFGTFFGILILFAWVLWLSDRNDHRDGGSFLDGIF